MNTIMIHTHRCLHVLVVFVTLLQISSLVLSLPIESSEVDDEAAYKDFEDLLHQAMLADLVSASQAVSDSALPPKSLHPPRPHFFRSPPPTSPTDTPTLRDLMRSALRTDLTLGQGKAYDVLQGTPLDQGEPLAPKEGQSLLKRALERGELLQRGNGAGGETSKRSFDSISRSSGFGGMNRGSWGGMSRHGENLTFTFESLFPAIARGLRSIN